MGWLRMAIIVLLLVLTITLFVWWILVNRDRMPDMTKYILISSVAHALVFILTMDLLVETGVVELEDISPALAIKVRSIEQSLGFEITPSPSDVSLPESETEASVSMREAVGTTEATKTAAARIRAQARSSAIKARRIDDLPEMTKNRVEISKHMTPKASLTDTVNVKKKLEQSRKPAEIERTVEAKRADVPKERAARPVMHTAPDSLPAKRRETAALPPLSRQPRAPVRNSASVLRKQAHLAVEMLDDDAIAIRTRAAASKVDTPPDESPTRLTRAEPDSGRAERVAALPRMSRPTDSSPGRATVSGKASMIRKDYTVLKSSVAVLDHVERPAAPVQMKQTAVEHDQEAPSSHRVSPAKVAGPAVEKRIREVSAMTPIAPSRSASSVPTALSARVETTGAMSRPADERIEKSAVLPAETTTDTYTGVAAKRADSSVPADSAPATTRVARVVETARGEDSAPRSLQGPELRTAAGSLPRLSSMAPAIAVSRRSMQSGLARTVLPAAPDVIDEVSGVTGLKRAAAGPRHDAATALKVAFAGTVAADTRAKARPADTVRARNTRLTKSRATVKPGTRAGTADSDLSFTMGNRNVQGSASTTVALARYQGGDWDCSPTAMMYLAHEIEERTGMALEATDKTVPIADPALMNVPFVYMTGHKDFTFTAAEIRNLRKYLESGGRLWADDSTHFNDETFDKAFRRELARVLPGKKLSRLGRDFPGFKTGYDLSNGYKGYAIPPGDKYRLDYIEGISIDDHVAVVYTRNDYGDGLNIDPNTHPIRPSLTDLSPAEMQEGAVQIGVNLVLYFLSSRAGSGTDFVDKTRLSLRKTGAASAPRVPKGPRSSIDDFSDVARWTVEDWSDTADLSATGRKLSARLSLGQKKKIAFSMAPQKQLRLSASDSLVVNADNRMACGARLAIGVTAGDRYYETRPFYLKPGTNAAFFRMSARTFKTEESDWEYKASLGSVVTADKLTVLIYSPASGTVILNDFKLVTGTGKP